MGSSPRGWTAAVRAWPRIASGCGQGRSAVSAGPEIASRSGLLPVLDPIDEHRSRELRVRTDGAGPLSPHRDVEREIAGLVENPFRARRKTRRRVLRDRVTVDAYQDVLRRMVDLVDVVVLGEISIGIRTAVTVCHLPFCAVIVFLRAVDRGV